MTTWLPEPPTKVGTLRGPAPLFERRGELQRQTEVVIPLFLNMVFVLAVTQVVKSLNGA